MVGPLFLQVLACVGGLRQDMCATIVLQMAHRSMRRASISEVRSLSEKRGLSNWMLSPVGSAAPQAARLSCLSQLPAMRTDDPQPPHDGSRASLLHWNSQVYRRMPTA